MYPGIKIIVSALTGVIFWKSFTPPTPPASPKDQVKTDGLFGRTIRQTSHLGKITNASAIICQIFVLLATCYPSSLATLGLSSANVYSRICPTVANALQNPRILSTIERESVGSAHQVVLSMMPNIATLSPSFILGAALITIFGSIRLWCFRTLANHFTFEISIQESHKLVRAGPYSFVRHPGYTCQILVIIGAFLMHFGSGSWFNECGILTTTWGKLLTMPWVILNITGSFGLFRRCAIEDEELKKVFGKEWIEYSKEVPYRLVPGLY